jgi:RNA polymerase sigma factor (sigma-70 family)
LFPSCPRAYKRATFDCPRTLFLPEEPVMITDEAFRALVGRVRAGEPEAAEELLRLYEPEVRRFIRLRLTDARLRRSFDSMDIFQSVFVNFFVRVAAGQYDLEEPGQVIRLLVTMARHKIVDHARKPSHRLTAEGGARLLEGLAEGGKSPSEIVSEQELLEKVRLQLTDEERDLAEQRASGCSWQEIAAGAGSTPDALRKKLERALDRVCQKLGVGGTSDE